MSFGLAALPVLAAAPSLVLGLSGLWLGMLLTRPDSAAPLAGYDRVDGARLWAVLALLAGAGWWAFHMPGCALWAVAAAMAALWAHNACAAVPGSARGTGVSACA